MADPLTPAELLAASLAAQTAVPGLGRLHSDEDIWCAARGPGEDALTEQPEARGVGPILLLQSQYDPATPLAAAEDAEAALDDAVLVVYEGEGHIATSQSECMDRIKDDFLEKGEIPDEGTTCPE